MKRRTFLAAAAIAALPLSLSAEPLDYTPGLVAQHLANGETVLLDFKADWCTTCRAQERVIGQLKAANPAYDDGITFINVDWDKYGNGELVNRLNIPRRSTLVVLKGDDELGRLVARTSQRDIQQLMDVALSAGS